MAEEIYVGMLEPKNETVIPFAIEAPSAKQLERAEKTFTVEYELRYSFKTMSIGKPIKFAFKVTIPRLGDS